MKKYRLAINGYGRIGRSILRALLERSELQHDIELIAINEPADIHTIAYLTRYDSTHGRLKANVSVQENVLMINGKPITISHAQQPEALTWQDQDIDLLLECSGSFESRDMAERYIHSGTKKILLSHPVSSSIDKTIVYGVNHQMLNKNDKVVSNGSCTTNCIVPILKILHERYGIVEGITTTIHSAMNDQPVTDAYHQTNLRLTRAAMQAVIPVETKLDKGIDRILPELTGRFRSNAIRVPTLNVSLIDLTVRLKKSVYREELNTLFKQAASSDSMSSILGYSDEPHASVDFNHDSRSVIIDGTQTQVCNQQMIKLVCWFDNEWGFSNRMLDTSLYWLKKYK